MCISDEQFFRITSPPSSVSVAPGEMGAGRELAAALTAAQLGAHRGIRRSRPGARAGLGTRAHSSGLFLHFQQCSPEDQVAVSFDMHLGNYKALSKSL